MILYPELRGIVRDMGETENGRCWREAADKANVKGKQHAAVAHLLRAAWFSGYHAGRQESDEE